MFEKAKRKRDMDEYKKLRNDLVFTEFIHAVREDRPPADMTQIIMDDNFFKNIYRNFTYPTN